MDSSVIYVEWFALPHIFKCRDAGDKYIDDDAKVSFLKSSMSPKWTWKSRNWEYRASRDLTEFI